MLRIAPAISGTRGMHLPLPLAPCRQAAETRRMGIRPRPHLRTGSPGTIADDIAAACMSEIALS